MKLTKQEIGAAVKYARLEFRRQQTTRYGLSRGKRTVLDEFPESVAGGADPSAISEHDEFMERARTYFSRAVNEYTRKVKYRELIHRVLRDGEQNSLVAEELGIKRGTAASIISRFRKRYEQGVS